MKILKLLFLLSVCVLLGATTASAQLFNLVGQITDENYTPLIGVSVRVENSNRGVISDANGKYTIMVSKGEVLLFSYLGYKAQKQTVIGNLLNVKLMQDVQELQDCVVIGYGGERKRDITGSISTVHANSRKLQKEVLASPAMSYNASFDNLNEEEYAQMKENRFISVSKDPLSTFSLDVDGASYSNMRRMVNKGAKPEPDAVRVEEFVNYFSYNYPKPEGNDPLKISYEVAECPWNNLHKLVRIGVKAKEIPSENLPATNFVFLVDVSGSMYERLPLVKSSLKLLVNNLRSKDRIAIVTYAGAAGVALASTPGNDKQKIREALDNLTAGGSTAGGEGIQLAYKIARQNFIKGGNNRIILATDGDFNVGVSSPEGLEQLIENERKSGVFLTVLGYGMGNYKDNKMQILAEKGNGNNAYIDNIQEANKVLVNEFGGTMYTVAKDVKLQIEFNPKRVKAFRLVGYESRLLEHEDFNDDTKDAGEIGAGHSVTALYEIVPVGVESNVTGSVDPLKYQPVVETTSSRITDKYPDLMTIKMRYKAPDGDVSSKIEVPVVESKNSAPSEDFYFAASVAMFAQLLRNSDFKGDATYDKVLTEARKGLSSDEYGYRREFIRLVESVKGMGQSE